MLEGAVQLPDGAWVRGRGLRNPMPAGPEPEFGLYLAKGPAPAWPHERIDWPDFWVPRDDADAIAKIRDLHARAVAGQRVEVACAGGKGRTGTVFACLAIVAGVAPENAVAWAREHYDRHAVETPWQKRWVLRKFR
ncbi:protein-tyrosine-phosphatase [Lentzea sp. NBRC 105346]|uniref:protein-tyrosine phosphatase family protein n=1 Tax=Lentzea sp. NBRC 105346 TaxID=3032205 RepID=UPI0024A3D49F|nr:protein-tyrosine phosphatase family protein [Lentzea sp. NBRC 105346]GLZ33461.1 protein-tyrosine-phosphatase [Lentzea sp. NBRC 105346]